jgi:hypothetical protein
MPIQINMEKAVRSGRPMLLPLIHHSYIILLIVQFNSEGVVKIAIMDPKAHLYKAHHRENIYRMA